MGLKAVGGGGSSSPITVLPVTVAQGGTGATSFTAGEILYGDGTNAIAHSANLKWDASAGGLGIGNPTVTTQLEVLKDDNNDDPIARFMANNGTAGVAINWSGIYAASSGSDADLTIAAKGTGFLRLAPGAGAPLLFGGGGSVYQSSNSINGQNSVNARETLYINYYGYNNGSSQFRDTIVADGKNQTIVTFSASSPRAMLPGTAGAVDIGSAALPFTQIFLDYTNSATVGNVTINKISGACNIAALGSTITVTNSLVTAASRIMATLASDPGVALSIWCVGGAGSFTVNTRPAVVNQTAIDFVVLP